MGILSITKLHDRAFRYLFLGQSAVQVNKWVEEFLDEYLDNQLYLPAIAELKKAKSNGDITVILSSSPSILVSSIAKRLDVLLSHATQYDIDKDGNFCNISFLMLGDDKAHFIKKLQDQFGCLKQNVKAFSDSHVDLPFLLAAGEAIGVNPNRRLRSICKKNRWPMI